MNIHAPIDNKACAGAALVEFAFILPFLLLLALPLVDFARAIHANLILANISREGANLASRSSLPYQQMLGSLAATAPPLDMNGNGMMYITKIMGHLDKGVVRNVIVEQHRWAQGWDQSAYSPPSAIWTCGDSGTAWAGGGANDGSCSGIPGAGPGSPIAGVMTGQLADGEVIFAVEGFYRFHTLFGGLDFGLGPIPSIAPDLHSMTLF